MTEQARSQLSPRHSQLNEVDAVTDPSEKQRNPAGEEMDCKDKHKVAEASAQYLAKIAPRTMPEDDTCPPGYKRTEVGVIPEDWEAIKMGDIAKIQRGASPRPIDSPIWFERNSTVGWLRISDVTKTRKYLTETTQYLSELGIANSRFVPKDNLVMSICATVGKPIITRKDLCIHDGFVVFNRLSTNQEYMYYVLKELEDEWGKQGQTGSQMNLNTDLINGTYIAIPETEKEQTAIANALSDVDALIGELEKLIAKKQAIKTATMQQLLTGRTRLPQFALREDGTHTNSSGTALLNEKGDAGIGGPKGEGQDGLRNGYKQSELGEIPEDWEVKKIGDIAPLQRGFDLPSSNRVDGKYPVVYSNGIVNTHCDFQVKGPGVVTGRSGTLGKVHYVEDDYWPHNTSLWVTKFYRTVPKFIYFIFKYIGFERFASGSGVPTLNRNDAHSFKVAVPSTEQEQTAIATILSDMDEEIQALQQRLAKTRQIKQGMMQELLTGRTRLIKTLKEVAHE